MEDQTPKQNQEIIKNHHILPKVWSPILIAAILIVLFSFVSVTPAAGQSSYNEVRLEDSPGSEEEEQESTRLEQREVEDEPETTGIEHEDIGISESEDEVELEDEEENESAQHNQTDLEFVQERASVSVKAVEVRGWDIKKKEEFLGTVKTHAELTSDEDLERFATGVLLRDENLEEVEIDEEQVRVNYRVGAKLFGLFPASLRAEATVETGAGEEIFSDKFGRVKVKLPWYHFLFSKSISAADAESKAQMEIDDEVLVTFESDSAQAEDRPTEEVSFYYNKISAQILEILATSLQNAQ